MSNRFSRRQIVTTVIFAIFAIFLLAACYFFILQPKKVELDKKEAELNTEEALLSQVQAQLSQENENAYESTVMLQKQVPVKPLLERLVLDIEKAEVLSGSFVESISFGEGGAITAEEENIQTEEDEQNGSGESITLPGGIDRVSINLVVVSPSYYELEDFINTLERTERIMMVDSIGFSGNDEITSIEQTEESLNYSLTVSAFYMPQLTELINQLPRIEAPQPGNKTNPLVTFTNE